MITRCDLRTSALGHSGSMGNAVRITTNHIYVNGGHRQRHLSSAGHPGFPADSVQIDHDFSYSNTFDTHSTRSLMRPLVTVSLGPGSSSRG